MQLDRNLSLGDSGADVRYVKDRLFSLGYYSDDVKRCSKEKSQYAISILAFLCLIIKSKKSSNAYAFKLFTHCTI